MVEAGLDAGAPRWKRGPALAGRRPLLTCPLLGLQAFVRLEGQPRVLEDPGVVLAAARRAADVRLLHRVPDLRGAARGGQGRSRQARGGAWATRRRTRQPRSPGSPRGPPAVRRCWTRARTLCVRHPAPPQRRGGAPYSESACSSCSARTRLCPRPPAPPGRPGCPRSSGPSAVQARGAFRPSWHFSPPTAGRVEGCEGQVSPRRPRPGLVCKDRKVAARREEGRSVETASARKSREVGELGARETPRPGRRGEQTRRKRSRRRTRAAAPQGEKGLRKAGEGRGGARVPGRPPRAAGTLTVPTHRSLTSTHTESATTSRPLAPIIV